MALELLVGDGVARQAARDCRRHRSVPGDVSRRGGAAKQGLIGHDEVDCDGGRDVGRVTGDAFEERVGHDLTATAVVEGGVGSTL